MKMLKLLILPFCFLFFVGYAKANVNVSIPCYNDDISSLKIDAKLLSSVDAIDHVNKFRVVESTSIANQDDYYTLMFLKDEVSTIELIDGYVLYKNQTPVLVFSDDKDIISSYQKINKDIRIFNLVKFNDNDMISQFVLIDNNIYLIYNTLKSSNLIKINPNNGENSLVATDVDTQINRFFKDKLPEIDIDNYFITLALNPDNKVKGQHINDVFINTNGFSKDNYLNNYVDVSKQDDTTLVLKYQNNTINLKDCFVEADVQVIAVSNKFIIYTVLVNEDKFMVYNIETQKVSQIESDGRYAALKDNYLFISEFVDEKERLLKIDLNNNQATLIGLNISGSMSYHDNKLIYTQNNNNKEEIFKIQ